MIIRSLNSILVTTTFLVLGPNHLNTKPQEKVAGRVKGILLLVAAHAPWQTAVRHMQALFRHDQPATCASCVRPAGRSKPDAATAPHPATIHQFWTTRGRSRLQKCIQRSS